jgi:hypothetical protein
MIKFLQKTPIFLAKKLKSYHWSLVSFNAVGVTRVSVVVSAEDLPHAARVKLVEHLQAGADLHVEVVLDRFHETVSADIYGQNRRLV